MGCWTPVETFAADRRADWRISDDRAQSSSENKFSVSLAARNIGDITLSMPGRHNRMNAVAAIAAARHAGVPVQTALDALRHFSGVKRRMELRGEVRGIKVYDDFAHHPTAIRLTLQGLRALIGDKRILTVLELRSNTMRMGVHRGRLAPALMESEQVFLYRTAETDWLSEELAENLGARAKCYDDTGQMITAICGEASADDHILIMSNGAFDNIHQRLLRALA